jgi:hypothetical protein
MFGLFVIVGRNWMFCYSLFIFFHRHRNVLYYSLVLPSFSALEILNFFCSVLYVEGRGAGRNRFCFALFWFPFYHILVAGHVLSVRIYRVRCDMPFISENDLSRGRCVLLAPCRCYVCACYVLMPMCARVHVHSWSRALYITLFSKFENKILKIQKL